MNHTPKFDQKINKVLSSLAPHHRKCTISGESFEIVKDDIEFYKSFQVPPPTLAPDMRYLRRALYRNARNLFSRNSDISGKQIISLYRSDSPFKIYDTCEYDRQKIDALQYGKVYDSTKSFFDQLHKLDLKIPRSALSGALLTNENSDYINNAGHCKNCYLCFLGGYSENCMYNTWFIQNKDSLDLFSCLYSELCYECSYAEGCYNVNFSNCVNKSSDSWFLYDCMNCHNCFACTNLRNKRYCFFNKQLTKEEYESKLKALKLSDFASLDKIKKEFREFLRQNYYFPSVNFGFKSEDCSGNNVFMSKKCRDSFSITMGENIDHSRDVFKARDAMDICYTGENVERTYEQVAGGMGIYDSKFVAFTGDNSSKAEYCFYCSNISDCFGCVGLTQKRFCILNKQYSEDEYWKLLDKIKCDMLDRKEYGEFMPFVFGSHPYIDSCATEDLEISKDEFEKVIEAENHYYGTKRKSILGYGEQLLKVDENAYEFCSDEDSWSDDKILNTIFASIQTRKPYKIQKQELEFYKKKKLPLPRLHPEERQWDRLYLRGKRKLHQIICPDCGKKTLSAYPDDFPGIAVCHNCYLKRVR